MNAAFDVTDIHIETDRLILRSWQESDLEDFYEYACVDGVGELAGWEHHESVEKTRETLVDYISGKKTFALELKDNRKVIGSISLNTYVRDGLLDFVEHLSGRVIGYCLSKDYWGMGLMPEAVNAVIGYCFNRLSFDWFICTHFIRNPQSRRVIEKCGFQYVEDITHTTLMGTVEPSCMYIIYNPNK